MSAAAAEFLCLSGMLFLFYVLLSSVEWTCRDVRRDCSRGGHALWKPQPAQGLLKTLRGRAAFWATAGWGLRCDVVLREFSPRLPFQCAVRKRPGVKTCSPHAWLYSGDGTDKFLRLCSDKRLREARSRFLVLSSRVSGSRPVGVARIGVACSWTLRALWPRSGRRRYTWLAGLAMQTHLYHL